MFRNQIGMKLEAVAGTLDVDHDSMMQELIELRSRDYGFLEDFTPFCEARLEVRIIAPFL